MPTKYTNQNVEGDFKIFRNDDHVATYDPVTEEVAYTDGNEKYAGPIGRQVSAIKAPPVEETPPPAPVVEEEPAPVVEEDLIRENRRLKNVINDLSIQLGEARDKNADAQEHVADRYKGIPTDPKNAPVQTANLGDLTPEFVEWARAGGYTEEQFLQVYTGRIKDLSYPITKHD